MTDKDITDICVEFERHARGWVDAKIIYDPKQREIRFYLRPRPDMNRSAYGGGISLRHLPPNDRERYIKYEIRRMLEDALRVCLLAVDE